jgi:hypothetical protein
MALTLALGGASVARAVTATPLDAHTALEFSLDGATWSDAPDLVLGSWGCDLGGGPTVPDPGGAIGGPPEVDPCSMMPGESIDRTYHVRNATDTGRTGRYAVGVGDYVVSDEAEFEVSSTITGAVDVRSQTVTLYGADTPRAADSPAPGSTVTSLDLAPGQTAKVVDEVAVPLEAENHTQRQSVTPMMWVSFSETVVVDTDGDGLPDSVEDELGTDPADPLNTLPDGTVGQHYGPERFLPTPPPGTELDVDTSTLPPGLRLEDGVLVGTPTRAGTFDVGFTVTLPGGGTHSSVRRVVIRPGPGGSAELPDLVGPIVVVGVIGLILAILGPGFGSLGGAIGGSLGGAGSVPGSPADSTTRSPESSADQSGANQSGVDPSGVDQSGAGRDGSDGDDDTGQVAVDSVTPREGSPSSEWARANSQVRESLADTGVGATDLLLWALTAAAAGATLILLASLRRRDPDDPPR